MNSVSTLLSLNENAKFRYFGDYQRDKQARGCNYKYQEPWPDIKILILTRLILSRTRNKAENAGLVFFNWHTPVMVQWTGLSVPEVMRREWQTKGTSNYMF